MNKTQHLPKTSLGYDAERGLGEEYLPAALEGGAHWKTAHNTSRADLTPTTSGVWLKCTKIVIFPSLLNWKTQSVLLNVSAVNEVVRLVTFTEIPTLLRNWYHNYLQLFTIKFIKACSGFRQYQIFEEFPLWLWSLPHQSNSTCLVKDRSLKQSSEK